jgi:hypothetical protein
MHAAGLLGQRFFLKKFKLADEDSHSTDSSVSGEEGKSDPQNCTKMLRNLTFVVQFAYFCVRPNKGREQQKNFFCLFEQLFEKLRATFWEISSNLWKAVGEALCHTPLSLVLVNLMSLLIFNWDVFALH